MQAQQVTSELEPVVRWRHDQLIAAGFAGLLALQIARDHRWDLHELLALRAHGCPPELAARIGAPLDLDDAELPQTAAVALVADRSAG